MRRTGLIEWQFLIAESAPRAGRTGPALRDTLVWRGLSFSDDAQLERLFRGIGQIEKLLQRSYTTPC